MANKNLDDLLWSVDRTVRRVLDSREINNLGNDIMDSLNRVGDELRGGFGTRNAPGDDFENDPGNSRGRYSSAYSERPKRESGSKYTPPGGYQRRRPSNNSYSREHREYARGWNTPERGKGYSGYSGHNSYNNNAQIVKREPNWRRGGAIVMTAAGFFFSFNAMLTTLILLSEILVGYEYASVPGMIFGVVLTVGFLPLGIAGARKLGLKSEMRRIWKYLKGREFCKISEVCENVRLSEKKTVRLLDKMIAQKYLPEGHFDETKTCLLLTDETYTKYLKGQEEKRAAEAKRREEEGDPQKAALSKMEKEGGDYIRRIREINDDLPDPIISAKLDELEKVCRQIFAYVSDHPEKLSDIRKLMSYYLPTTLKLLEAYRKLALQDTGAESEEKTEQEILSALDNINLAFNNLLDELMKNDYMDLSSDISALKSMLASEGLVGGMPDIKTDNKTGDAASDESYEPELHI